MLKMVILAMNLIAAECSSNILVMFPVPSKSHSIISDSLVMILLEGGHNVTYISHYTRLKPSARLRHINIFSKDVTGRNHLNLLDVVNNPQRPQQVFKTAVEYSRQALEHEDVKEILLDLREQYDAVIAEWYYNGLLSPLAALFKCPLIWYSCEDVSWMSLQVIHEQSSPVHSVDLMSTNMAACYNIWSRVYRLWRQMYLTARIYYTIAYQESTVFQNIYEPLFPHRGISPTDYESLLYNGSFLFINSHPAIGQNLPLPNNAKYVGGHHIEEPVKILPPKLLEMLNNSTKGVILFSFGTEVSIAELPLKMKWHLMDIFGELEQTVIWKMDEYMEDLPKNVFAVKWMPQKIILNHTNTILFINQGGFTSNLEAAYYGVPTISVPLYGDQFVSADIMAAGGRGLRVEFSEEFPEKLKEAINIIFGNESYKISAKSTSSILQSSLVPPSKELLYWVDLVIRTNGAPHLRSPAVQLSVFERLYLDVLALLAMIFWFLTKVWKVILVHTCEDDDDDKKNQ